MNVRIEDEDELSSFIFRSTGFNSIRTLATRLRYFHAVSGGALASLPLELRLRGKSTTQSHRAPIYYADLVTRSGMSLSQAIGGAKATCEERRNAGFDQAALDDAARAGFSNGAFEDSEEEGVAITEEFYPGDTGANSGEGDVPTTGAAKTSLREKLERKAAAGQT